MAVSIVKISRQYTFVNGAEDHRYTIRVDLLRSGRPRYFEFHCLMCGIKICECDGTIIHVGDVSDDTALPHTSAIRVRCPGKFCRTWYQFQLL